MSYELSITRADRWPETEHWSENNRKAITFEEWEQLIESDAGLAIDYSGRLSSEELERLVDATPELAGCRADGGFRFSKEQNLRLKELAEELKRNDTPDLGQIGSDTVDWKAHPRGEARCFWLECEGISTKNPDIATLDKMLELADKLEAHVRGDDGEIYRRSGGGFDCYKPERGWLPLEEFHRGRPDWAAIIIREIAGRKPV